MTTITITSNHTWNTTTRRTLDSLRANKVSQKWTADIEATEDAAVAAVNIANRKTRGGSDYIAIGFDDATGSNLLTVELHGENATAAAIRDIITSILDADVCGLPASHRRDAAADACPQYRMTVTA